MIVYTLHKGGGGGGGGGGDDDDDDEDDDNNNINSPHSVDDLKERIWNVLCTYSSAHL